MNYIGYNIWERGSKFLEFYKSVISNNWDKVILFYQNEFQWIKKDYPEHFAKIIIHLKSINKPLHIITGASNINYPFSLPNTIVYFWDTYWLGKTYVGMVDVGAKNSIDPYCNIEYKFHFISMNGKPRLHRCLMIDLLSKENLLKNNAISMLQKGELYTYKYFKFEPLILEKQFLIDYQDQYNTQYEYNETPAQYRVPDQYYKSFAHLVTESSTDIIILSEKTSIPLLLGKPFLILGAKHFHKFLQQRGFQLYDEIFDYSFDNEPVLHKRAEKIIENLKNLSNIPLQKLPDLQKKIAHKIEFNKLKARNIIFDTNFYPKIALEVIDHYKSTGEKIDKHLINVHLRLEELKQSKF